MTKKQLWTQISGGILNLFVLGSITSCGNIYQGNTGGVKNGWENKNSGFNAPIYGISCNGNTWVAVGGSGSILVSTDNGNTWNKKNSEIDTRINDIACNGNTWIAVGIFNAILISTDNGNSWIKKNIGVNIPFYSIAYNSNTWIIMGEQGTILRSQDTAVWN